LLFWLLLLPLPCQLEQLLDAALGSCAAASLPLLAQLALQLALQLPLPLLLPLLLPLPLPLLLALLISATRLEGAVVARHGLVMSATGCAHPAGLEHPLAPIPVPTVPSPALSFFIGAPAALPATLLWLLLPRARPWPTAVAAGSGC
jgi:hypothetical protein